MPWTMKPLKNQVFRDKINSENNYEQTSDPIHRQHLADVLRTSVASNPETYTKMREAGKMSEAVEYIFADKIEKIAEKKKKRRSRTC